MRVPLTYDEGRPVLVVGTGYPSFWHRPTNTYPGCNCPPWRYNPRHPKPTDPGCPRHGQNAEQCGTSLVG